MPDGLIYIEKIQCQIKVTDKPLGQRILHAYSLTADSLKRVLAKVAYEGKTDQFIQQDKLVINLGTISAEQFDREFNLRLAKKLAALWQQQITAEITDDALGVPAEALTMTAETARTVSVEELSMTSQTTLTEQESEYAILEKRACICLEPLALKQLLQREQTIELKQLLQQLLVTRSQPLYNVPLYSKVTASRLSFAALIWLVQENNGRRWLSGHFLSISQLDSWVEAIASGEIDARQVMQLLSEHALSLYHNQITHRWLLPLWQKKGVRHVVNEQLGHVVAKDLDDYFRSFLQHPIQPLQQARISPTQQEPLLVSNAGIVLLWPLLPQLFSVLELATPSGFINQEACWQAVICLDWLVWAKEELDERRLVINRLLCGISPDMPQPELTPLTPAQQQQIDSWLSIISQQPLPLNRLSLTDIRQLFLQRPGEIHNETLPPQIVVRPEPFDLLLDDWPWPLTLASFPWLEQPLTIIWLCHNLTG